jgi:hypothetical protein
MSETKPRKRPPLKDEQVADARRRYAQGQGKVTLGMLEEELGLGPGPLRKMLVGATFAHVPGAVPRMMGNRGRRRLTTEQVIEMRALYPQPGWTLKKLVAKFGGDANSLRKALLGWSYHDVPGALDTLKPAGVTDGAKHNWRRKLAPEVVLFMRLQYRPRRVTVTVLSKAYNVDLRATTLALRGLHYKEVPEALPHLGDKPVRAHARLTISDLQVSALRTAFRTGRRSARSIAHELKVGEGPVVRMLRGKSHKHVPSPVLESLATLRKRRDKYLAACREERERRIARGQPIRPLIKAIPPRLADHDEAFDRNQAA